MPDHHASCSCGHLRLVGHGDRIRMSMCHCLACQRGSVYEERRHSWVTRALGRAAHMD